MVEISCPRFQNLRLLVTSPYQTMIYPLSTFKRNRPVKYASNCGTFASGVLQGGGLDKHVYTVQLTRGPGGG